MLYLNKYDIFQFPNIRQVDFLIATQLLKFFKEILQDNERAKVLYQWIIAEQMFTENRENFAQRWTKVI